MLSDVRPMPHKRRRKSAFFSLTEAEADGRDGDGERAQPQPLPPLDVDRIGHAGLVDALTALCSDVDPAVCTRARALVARALAAENEREHESVERAAAVTRAADEVTRTSAAVVAAAALRATAVAAACASFDDKKCHICGRADDEARMLLCDGCAHGACHLGCLDPPLAIVPEGEWFCPRCEAARRPPPPPHDGGNGLCRDGNGLGGDDDSDGLGGDGDGDDADDGGGLGGDDDGGNWFGGDDDGDALGEWLDLSDTPPLSREVDPDEPPNAEAASPLIGRFVRVNFPGYGVCVGQVISERATKHTRCNIHNILWHDESTTCLGEARIRACMI